MKRSSWIELWSKHVSNAYLEDPDYWSNIAREYDRKILANGQLIGKLKQFLNNEYTVLDVGAGTGYPVLALAPFVEKVIAVEPSEGMLNVLRDKADNAGISNIDYINRKWENTEAGEYDIVLASHSICCVKDPLEFLLKMHKSAKRFVIIVLFTNFDIILMSGKKPPKPSYLLLYNMLCNLGIYANMEIFKSYRRFFYKSKEDAIRDIGGHINKEYIHGNLRETNDEFFLNIDTDEVIIWYKKDDA